MWTDTMMSSRSAWILGALIVVVALSIADSVRKPGKEKYRPAPTPPVDMSPVSQHPGVTDHDYWMTKNEAY